MFGRNDMQDTGDTNATTTVSGPAPDATLDSSTTDTGLELPSSSAPAPGASFPPPAAPLIDPTAAPATTPATAPAPAVSPAAPAAAPDDLIDIKQEALQQLSPLIGHLDQTPEEKFRTTMMLIQATDDHTKIKDAYDAAQAITDDKARAQALLDVVNEINYFTQQHQNNSPDTPAA